MTSSKLRTPSSAARTPPCPGLVDGILAGADAALAEPYEDPLGRALAAEALNLEATGRRTAGEGRALWGAFTARHALFRLACSPHADHAGDLPADTKAIVTSDRWWAYARLPTCRGRLCRSHRRRDFAAHAEGLDAEKDLGEAGPALCGAVFCAFEVFSHSDDRSELRGTVGSLQRTYKPIVRP